MTSAAVSKRVLAISNRFSVSFMVEGFVVLAEALRGAEVFNLASKGVVKGAGHIHVRPADGVFLHFSLLHGSTLRRSGMPSTFEAGMRRARRQERAENSTKKVNEHQESKDLNQESHQKRVCRGLGLVVPAGESMLCRSGIDGLFGSAFLRRSKASLAASISFFPCRLTTTRLCSV